MSDEILDESLCSQIVDREIEIGLDPKFIGNEERSINRIISNMKYKYNYELKGILLDYRHLKFVSDYGRIIDDQPYIYWKVRAQFTIFNVCVGQLIRIKINRLGTSLCGALIGNCIDATITFSEDIAKQELDPYLKIDQEIIFMVQGFDMGNFFINGIIDQNCLDKIKELIELGDDYNETFSNTSFFP